MAFKSNTVYLLNEGWGDYYSQVDEFNPDGIRYDRAKATTGSTGMFITDCWICDRYGNRHPGYSNSPVPVRWDSIVREQPFLRKVKNG